MMNPKLPTILFLSSGNAARSILAEALTRHMAGSRFMARSAGLHPLPFINTTTLFLLAESNISCDNLHTKGVGEFLAASSLIPINVIVTLSEEARVNCPSWPNDPVRVHWTVDDPLAATKDDVRDWKFKKCFATLQSRITALIKNRAAQSNCELLLQLKDVGMVV